MAATLTQLPSPLRPASTSGALTDDQWRVLAALVDTVVPAIVPDETLQNRNHVAVTAATYHNAVRHLAQTAEQHEIADTLAVSYLEESASSCPGFRDAVNRLVYQYADSEQKKGLLLILNALNTRAGAILLTGKSTVFPDLSAGERQQVISGWANAYLPFYRSLFRSFSSIARFYWIQLSPTLGNVLTFPKLPVNHNFGDGFPFSFVQFPPDVPQQTESDVFETDVVIVGSGCSGAVAASVLAAAGLEVTVCDRSYYWPPKHLPMTEYDGTNHLFLNGGLTANDEGMIPILSGSCWGGGGTVNWSASLHLQGFVRQQWAASSGVPYFTSAAFQTDMDAVFERMGAGTAHIEHNKANSTLLEGARKLGMNAKAVPQNTGGQAHQCGYCTLGCGSCGKRGPTETWLPDAAKSGAKFIEGFQCDEILYADAVVEHGERIATGVRGVWTSRDTNGGVSGSDAYSRPLTIRARHAVILAAGALATPLLLQRSGVRNRHLGRHLHIHPVSMAGGVFDDDVRPWEGGILTSVVNDLENLDSRGHGVKLEATTMIPTIWLLVWPWINPLQWKLFAAQMRRSVGYICLARDESEGRVFPDPVDPRRVRIQYSVNKADKRRIARGLDSMARILYVQGARRITINVPGVPDFVRAEDAPSAPVNDDETGVNNPAFQHWLQTYIAPLIKAGHPKESAFGSAHQMGTARMGSSPSSSVIDPKGRVWGTKHLYIVDTSAFPSASGVNPMITCMGLARGIARGLVRDLGRDGGAERARL